MSNVLKILLCCALVCVFATDASALVIEDGTGTSAGGDWTLKNSYALSVQANGAGGIPYPHDYGTPTPPYAGETGYTTFWHEGAATNSWVAPSYGRTDFAGDLSANMNGYVKVSMRTINWVLSNYSFARTNHVMFIFDGTVGGVNKIATFALYTDEWALATYGWTPGVMQDIEVNLVDGIFTKTGSTYPSGTTNDSLAVMQYSSVDAGNALEFWQNITRMRITLQTCSMLTSGSAQYDTWLDIEYVEIVAEDPTNCAEVLAQGYTIDYDLNGDCKVNFEDFSIIADEWHDCITPGVAGCDQPWLP